MATANLEANANQVTKRIRDLKQKRKYFKAQVTSLSNFVEKYMDSEKERVKLQERIERLRNLFTAFNANIDELVLLEDNFEEIESEREDVMNAYDDALAAAIVLQRSLQDASNIPERYPSVRDSPAPSGSSFSLPVRLPKIDLPKFDGRIEKWVTFKDAFNTMIHSQPGLSNIQKLNYLRLSLSGRAEIAIGAFTISEDNYEAAWKHLVEIYDNKRALVLRHAALLRDTPMMTDDSSESVRDLASYMQLHVRSLQALGRSWADIGNDILVSIVISRMSKETRKTWERTLSDTKVPKIEDIFKFLHITSHQCKDYESVSYAKHTSNFKSDAFKNHERTPITSVKTNRMRNPPPSSSRLNQRQQTFVTTANSQPSNLRRVETRAAQSQKLGTQATGNCKICNNGPHATFNCKMFVSLPIEKRIEAARKARLCLNCLLDDHTTEECKAGKCRVCNQMHNTRLHYDAASRSASPSQQHS
ncbi:uncharacterized protein LOC143183301 [Calliopsis andreniformis]|uniref:uncharacterized protein LOC143183301 n=1 Tax=Calliopsis andreniformis TaxID=337506 RepID=UPI003FCEC2DF